MLNELLKSMNKIDLYVKNTNTWLQFVFLIKAYRLIY